MIPTIAIVEQYPVLLDDINKMIVEYQAIAVVPGDTASYKEARAACTTLVHTRTAIEAKRKDLLRDYRDNVNQVADALLAPLTPVETRLKAELKAEDDRKAEIRAKAEAIEKKRVDDIKSAIFKLVNYANAQGKTAEQIGKRIEAIETHEITEPTYQEFVAEAILAKATTLKTLRDALAECEKVEREEAARKAEAERLEAVRVQQEAEQKRLNDEREAQAAKLKAERDAIDEARRKIEEEKAAIEAEKAAIEAAKQPVPEAEVEEVPVTEETMPSFEIDRENLLSYFNVVWNVKRPEIQNLTFDSLLSEFVSDLNKYKQRALGVEND